jgi:DNA replicative helicase MCM subunit Mcm2 (Cdc46/Mcm family)
MEAVMDELTDYILKNATENGVNIDFLTLADEKPRSLDSLIHSPHSVLKQLRACAKTKYGSAENFSIDINGYYYPGNQAPNYKMDQCLYAAAGGLVFRSDVCVMKTAAVFRCTTCGSSTKRDLNENEWNPTFPNVKSCGTCNSEKLVHVVDEDPRSNYQEIILDLQLGHGPRTQVDTKLTDARVSFYVTNNTFGNINSIPLGAPLQVIGIVRIRSAPVSDGTRMMYQVMCEAIAIHPRKFSTFSSEPSVPHHPLIQARMAHQNNQYQWLRALYNSFCPRIFGGYCFKFLLLLVLVNRCSVERDQQAKRTLSHLLIISKPDERLGYALEELEKYSPVKHVAGVSTSAAGLGVGCSVGGSSTNAGALISAGTGICLVTEVNYLKKDAISILSQAMENQRFFYAKSKVKVEINTNCAVVATANPSKKQLLPGATLSRFDIILTLQNELVHDKVNDRRMFQYLIEEDWKSLFEESEPMFSENDLNVILQLASRNVVTSFQGEAEKIIKELDRCLDTKGKGIAGDYTIVDNGARRFEALIRLARAHSKLFLHETITEFDALHVAGLILSTLKPIDLTNATYPSSEKDFSIRQYLDFVRQTIRTV